MKGLDDRSRDEDGEIRQKRGDSLNKNLPKPIPQFSPNATLAYMREQTGKVSEESVRRAAKKMKEVQTKSELSKASDCAGTLVTSRRPRVVKGFGESKTCRNGLRLVRRTDR